MTSNEEAAIPVTGKPGMEPVYLALAARVRALREALGLGQAELARRIGQTRSSIANIEAGRQRILLAEVERLAAALGTSPKNLMKGIWW